MEDEQSLNNSGNSEPINEINEHSEDILPNLQNTLESSQVMIEQNPINEQEDPEKDESESNNNSNNNIINDDTEVQLKNETENSQKNSIDKSVNSLDDTMNETTQMNTDNSETTKDEVDKETNQEKDKNIENTTVSGSQSISNSNVSDASSPAEKKSISPETAQKLLTKLRALQSDNKKLKTYCETCETSLNETTHIKEVREQQLEEKSNMLLNTQNELNSCLEQITVFKNTLVENTNTINTLNQQIEELKNENIRLHHVDNDLKDAQMKVSELMEEGLQLAKKQGTNETTIRNLKTKVKSITEELTTLKSQSEKDVLELSKCHETIQHLEANKKELTQNTDSNNSLLNETRQSLTELTQQYDILKVSQERLMNENEVYKNEKLNDEALITSLQKQNKELNSKYSTINATMLGYDEKIKHAQEAYTQNQELFNEKEKEMNTYINKLEKDKQELMTKTQLLQNQIMQATTSSLSDINAEKQKTMKLLEKMSEQKSQLLSIKQELEYEKQKNIDLQAGYDRYVLDRDKIINENKERIMELETKVSDLTDQKHLFTMNNDVINDYKTKINEYENEIKFLNEKVLTEKANHEKEVKMLTDHIHINNTTIDENNKLINILQKQIQKFNKAELERPSPTASNNHPLIDKENLFISPYECILNNEIKTKEGQIQSLQSIIERLKDNESKSRVTVLQLTQQIEQYKNVENENKQCQETIKQYQSKIDTLTLQINDLCIEIEDLKEQRNLYKQQFMNALQQN